MYVQVSFEMSDVTKHDFEENTFDVIYSRWVYLWL